jgi:Na+-transporting NADH:ubiquinone oxidoreductase subunit E
MQEYINIIIKSIFTENMIFAFFIGMCSYLAVSKTVKTSIGLGIAVIFVQMVTVPLNYYLLEKVLKPGAMHWLGESFTEVDLSFLSFMVYIATIAAMVQLVEMIVEKFSPSLYNSLGIFLPLIAVNCAILAGSLFMEQREYRDIGEVLAFSFGSGFGWAIAIVTLAAIRERIRYSHIPAPLRGLGITFIITGLLGIAFMSFMGIKL